MHNTQKYEEPMITVQIQPNEAIAVNLAISYFMRHCNLTSPVYPEACELLSHYQRRLTEQLHIIEGPPSQLELRH